MEEHHRKTFRSAAAIFGIQKPILYTHESLSVTIHTLIQNVQHLIFKDGKFQLNRHYFLGRETTPILLYHDDGPRIFDNEWY